MDIQTGHEYRLTIEGESQVVRVKQLIPPKYARVATKSKKLITCSTDQLKPK